MTVLTVRETSPDGEAVVPTVYADVFPAAYQPQPFPLQGSKRGQVSLITCLIPEGKPKLFEPFCGSAAVSIGARLRNLVSDVQVSDANPALVALWGDILGDPLTLADQYEELWNQQTESGSEPLAFFNAVRERHNRGVDTNSADFLFILNRIVKGALRYNRAGEMNQGADGRRLGARPATVRKRLRETSAVMRGASPAHLDWNAALESALPADIVYLDPPYQGTSTPRDARYISGLDVDAFEEGLSGLIEQGISAIISYDAIRGPALYGRPLSPALGLLPLDVVTGISAQGTLLGRRREAHETIYLTPALVDRLGGVASIWTRVGTRQSRETQLIMAG